MILQALVEYYEDLERAGKISAPGWGPAKISYVLYLSADGQLEQVTCIKVPSENGKKLVPQVLSLPAAVKRSVGIASNFLWDNAAYILGITAESDKAERALRCREACAKLHLQLLETVDSPAANALKGFFATWNPNEAMEHPLLQDCLEDILAGANLTFRFRGQYVSEDPEIRAAWQNYYDGSEDGTEMTCLVTGKKGTVARLHPAIKGVQGAQSSGAPLVSFNAPSFCSYGKEQGFNAPTGEYAAFAYGAALNYLLSDWKHVVKLGDTTVLCWAKGGEPAYQGFFGVCLFGQETAYRQTEVQDMLKQLAEGNAVDFDETKLDPQKPFYILGLAPNAARLSVRFFQRNSFGAILKNIQKHYRQTEIVRPSYDPFQTVPLWKLLSATVNQNSKDKKPSNVMSGEVLRAVLNGTRYPATLRNGVNLRIRAEHTVTRERAAIIKAYYLRNPCVEFEHPEEVFTVTLNRESNNLPYNLGRLFSVLEDIQSTANPGINSTIRDKYFNSACATPSVVFPTLIKLAQKHLRKIGGGLAVVYSKQLQEIMDKLDDNYPARLTLPEQGSFQLGYYHQTSARYQGNQEEM